MQELRCGECNDVLGVGKRCLNCKKNYYYERVGVIVDYCKSCVVVKKVFSNGECRACLQGAGLKQCRRCEVVLPQHLSFQKEQGQCGDCRNVLRRVRRALRRS
jgi:hypothetical protein